MRCRATLDCKGLIGEKFRVPCNSRYRGMRFRSLPHGYDLRCVQTQRNWVSRSSKKGRRKGGDIRTQASSVITKFNDPRRMPGHRQSAVLNRARRSHRCDSLCRCAASRSFRICEIAPIRVDSRGYVWRRCRNVQAIIHANSVCRDRVTPYFCKMARFHYRLSNFFSGLLYLIILY